jgi:metal-responsive CopG/Arc/MetJ family transcriptional regulator
MNKPKRVILQAPAPVVEAIDKVSARRFTTRSQYIRQAILEALQRDGVQPIAA